MGTATRRARTHLRYLYRGPGLRSLYRVTGQEDADLMPFINCGTGDKQTECGSGGRFRYGNSAAGTEREQGTDGQTEFLCRDRADGLSSDCRKRTV